MADGKELKPKSFRIDEETAEKFKEIANSIGGNQQEALAKLIEVYEMQAGKVILVDRKGDIEQFESYMSAITRMYMGSLEDGQNARETARMEFDALLKSKDTVIQSLQEELEKAKEQKAAAVAESKSKFDECSRLESEIAAAKEQMKNLQAVISDKEHLNEVLTDSCNDLKAKIESMGDIVKLQEDLAYLQKENIRLEQLMKNQKEQSQIEMDRALLEQEKKIQEQSRKEIEKYEGMLLDLVGKFVHEPAEGEPAEEKPAEEKPARKRSTPKKGTN